MNFVTSIKSFTKRKGTDKKKKEKKKKIFDSEKEKSY